MRSASATDALESFGTALKSIPNVLRKTPTCGQSKEMIHLDAPTLHTGMQVHCDDMYVPGNATPARPSTACCVSTCAKAPA